ncbi:hypothetical protein DFJ74DRAFT_711475 [Hyaloraphidium curvatum]|nr:hypothetical protein DFJ74DRAFT_711475 [Hyaloraphidium curvatum]
MQIYVRRLVGSLSRLGVLLAIYSFVLDASLPLLLLRLAAHSFGPRLRPAAHAWAAVAPNAVCAAAHALGGANPWSIVLDFLGREQPSRAKLLLVDFAALAADLLRCAAMLTFARTFYSASDLRGYDLDGRPPPLPPEAEAPGGAADPPPPPRLRTVFPWHPAEGDPHEAQPSDDDMLALLPTLVVDLSAAGRVLLASLGKGDPRAGVGGNSRGVPV